MRALAVLVAVVAPMTQVVPTPVMVRAVPVLLLLSWAPGYAVAVLPGTFTDPLLRALLAISVSLAATVAVSTALLYLGLWTAPTVLLVLCGVTLLGALWKSVATRAVGARP